MSEDISTDINDYTIQELYDILDLNSEDVIVNDVVNSTDQDIQRYTQEGNQEMATFFQEIKTRIG